MNLFNFFTFFSISVKIFSQLLKLLLYSITFKISEQNGRLSFEQNKMIYR